MLKMAGMLALIIWQDENLALLLQREKNQSIFMKRTTITIISLIIGASFFGLLFLQGRIVDAMVKMRKAEFDEVVFRALDQTSRDMERNETFRYLETVAANSDYEVEHLSEQMQRQRVQETLNLGDTTQQSPFTLQVQTHKPSQTPKALSLRPASSLDAASLRFQEFVKNENLMDEGKGMDTIAFANAIGECPLAFQPGTAFRYGTSADVLGAIVEIVSGMPYADFLKERIFEPLGMKDTAFYVPEKKKDRLVTCYQRGVNGLEIYPVRHLCVRDHAHAPAFASGGAGLMSTLDDYAAFAGMLLGKGEYKGERLLEEKTVDWMTRPQVDTTLWDNLTGFAYGRLMRICTEPGKASIITETGEYGWDGWLGTYFANLPASDMTILIFQNTRDTGTGRVTRCVRNRVVSAYCGVEA